MQGKGLIAAAVLLAALGGGVWYSNRLEADKAGKPPADASPKLIDTKEDQFTKLEIAKKGAAPVIVERAGSSWKMTAPKPLPVDPEAIASIASTLASFGSDKLVEEKATDLSAFGLNDPSLSVAISMKDGKNKKLLIGDETPTGGGSYAKLDGDPRVFTIHSYNKSSIDKTWKDLRDKRLLTFDDTKVTKVEVAAKGQSFELGKASGGDWQIVKPGPYRADNLQAEEIVRKLKDAKMDATVSDEETAKAAGLFASGTLVARASVTDSGGAQQIEVRKNKDDYYAKSSALEGIYKVTGDVGTGLDKTIDDLRNKKLFDFGFSEPSKVEVRDGDKTTVLTKSGENWQRGGKNLDSPGVQQLIDKLRDLSSIRFMTSGYTTPVLEMTLVSNEGKRTEKVQVAKQGNYWIAKRENEPALYEIDGKVMEEIQKAVTGLKEASSAPAKK